MKKPNKSGLKKNQIGTHFSLEIDTKGIVIFSIMTLLTAGTIFYLGVIFGKAVRDPNIRQGQLPGMSANEGEDGSVKKLRNNLKIYDIRDKNPKKDEQSEISTFKKDILKKSDEADQLINFSQDVLRESKAGNKSNQVKTKEMVAPDKPVKKITASPVEKNKAWPDNTARSPTGVFTIQILATKNRSRAESFRDQLKAQNFDAYITEIKLQGKMIYRVRVGRRNKNEIQQLKARLSTAVKGLGKLVVIKI